MTATAAWRTESATLSRLKAEREELDRQIREAHAASENTEERLNAAATRYIEGGAAAGAAVAELTTAARDLTARRDLVERAISQQSGKVREAKAARDHAFAEDRQPMMKQRAQKFAEALEGVRSAADEFAVGFEEFRRENVGSSILIPGVDLRDFHSGNRYSVVNATLKYLERVYSVKLGAVK